MKEKQHRNCETCIAYYNMLGGEDNRRGLGFRVAEEAETDNRQQWHGYIRPFEEESWIPGSHNYASVDCPAASSGITSRSR